MRRRKTQKLQENNYNCVLYINNISLHFFCFLAALSETCWQHLGISWDFTMEFFQMMLQAKIQYNYPFFMEAFNITT
jgi:hypothetical protein